MRPRVPENDDLEPRWPLRRCVAVWIGGAAGLWVLILGALT